MLKSGNSGFFQPMTLDVDNKILDRNLMIVSNETEDGFNSLFPGMLTSQERNRENVSLLPEPSYPSVQVRCDAEILLSKALAFEHFFIYNNSLFMPKHNLDLSPSGFSFACRLWTVTKHGNTSLFVYLQVKMTLEKRRCQNHFHTINYNYTQSNQMTNNSLFRSPLNPECAWKRPTFPASKFSSTSARSKRFLRRRRYLKRSCRRSSSMRTTPLISGTNSYNFLL